MTLPTPPSPRSRYDFRPFLFGVVIGAGIGLGWQAVQFLAALLRGQP